MDDTRKKVIEILDKYIFDKKVWEQAPENPKIISDLKINSARIVDVILDIEEFYGIEVDDDTLEGIFSVDDMVRVIREKTGS